MGFLPHTVAVGLLCEVCVGVFGVVFPLMERKKKLFMDAENGIG